MRKIILSKTPLADFRNLLARNRLISNAGVYVLGNLMQKALAFLLIPVYTRYLSPEDYGITGLAFTTGTVITIVLGFGIFGSIARHYFDFAPASNRLKEYITTNYLALLIFSGILTFLLDLTGPYWWSTITSGNIPYAPYIRIVLWTSFAEMLFQIPLSLYRNEQNAVAFISVQTFNFVLTLLATILFVVFFQWGATGQLLGSFVASTTTATLLSVIVFRRWFTPHINWGDLKMSLSYGLPLVPHSLAAWAMAAIGRFILEPRVSLAELGLYNLGYQVGMVMAVLVNSINMAWMPYYFGIMKNDAQPEKKIQRVVELYVALVGGLCLVIVLFSRELLGFLVQESYQPAAVYIPLILFSYLLNGYYFFFSAPLFYFKKTNLIPIITISSAVINVMLNFWWISFFGALGSAWATSVTYIFFLGISFVLARRWILINFAWGRLLVTNLLLFGAVLLATYGSFGDLLIFYLVKLALVLVFSVLSIQWFILPNLQKTGNSFGK